jgi:DNA-3-methyladenine glycosylase I
MGSYNNLQLKKIFASAEQALFNKSPFSRNTLNKNFKTFKTLHKKQPTYDDVYWIISRVVFYSGFKAATVNQKLRELKKHFGNFRKVASYSESDIKRLLKNHKLIRHRQKISGCIHNAKSIIALKQRFPTFIQYFNSFGSLEIKENLDNLIKSLRRKFKYLGNITVYHFLTDIGVNVIKPDRVLCRIFNRLGLVNSINDYWGVIESGRRFAKATKLPIRYIDIIFVFYGQVDYKYELDIEDGICLERKPKCNECNLIKYCDFYKKIHYLNE